MSGDLFQDPNLYRFVVGALQYANLRRPEISFAVKKVFQFMGKLIGSIRLKGKYRVESD